jgi:hypothetical protein
MALAAVAAGGIGGSAAADPSGTAASKQELVGRSVQKRAITAVQIGDPAGSRVALVVGVIHGDERTGLRIVREIRREASRHASELAGTQLWAIATVNPDGLSSHTRKNAHGVDLNRNFPYRWRGDVPHSSGYYPGPRPASEPETRAVMAFVRRIKPVPPALGRGARLSREPAGRRGVRETGRHAHELQGQGPEGDRDHLGGQCHPGKHGLRGRDAAGRDQRPHGDPAGAGGPDHRRGPLR